MVSHNRRQSHFGQLSPIINYVGVSILYGNMVYINIKYIYGGMKSLFIIIGEKVVKL